MMVLAGLRPVLDPRQMHELHRVCNCHDRFLKLDDLEDGLQRELGQARRPSQKDTPKIGGGYISDGQTKVRVISHIERFSAELQMNSLGQRKVLKQRQVNIGRRRTASNVPPCVAELARLCLGIKTLEMSGINPLTNRMRASIRIAHKVGAAREIA